MKPNCGNCDKKKCSYHKWIKRIQSEDLRTTQYFAAVTKEVGCLSHPNAREYLMQGVIRELERRAIKCGLHEDYDKAETYNKAIALIRGVK